jgi:hypothetical protein
MSFAMICRDLTCGDSSSGALSGEAREAVPPQKKAAKKFPLTYLLYVLNYLVDSVSYVYFTNLML